MKLIRYTFLSLVLTAGIVSEVSAQERGEGRGHQRREIHTPSQGRSQKIERPQARNEHRIESRSDNRGNRDFQIQNNRVEKRNTEIVRVDRDRNKNIGQNNNNNIIYRNPSNSGIKHPIKIDRNQFSQNNFSFYKPVKHINYNNYNRYNYNNFDFYGHNGIYYRNWNNQFVRFMPPVGFRINILPVGYITINLGNRGYYFYEGVYYERYNNYYKVVQPPVGAIVNALPAGYEKINYYGDVLYEFAGVLYDKIYSRGNKVYQVVGYLS